MTSFSLLSVCSSSSRFSLIHSTNTPLNPTATLEQTHLLPSRILSPHARYYVREMRILAYAQLLKSYRSLTLESLSQAFGVGVEFVDRFVYLSTFFFFDIKRKTRTNTPPSELSRFIALSRLHASIDKVHGIVETRRPSLKNAQHEKVVKQGDVLLNDVQRLSKVLY